MDGAPERKKFSAGFLFAKIRNHRQKLKSRKYAQASPVKEY